MKYENLLQNLLPSGLAFAFVKNKLQQKLLGGLSGEFDRVDLRAKHVLDEADPRTTNELIEEWEQMLGLPGDCFAGLSLSIEERRAAILAKLLDTGRNTKAAIEHLISSYGHSGTVTEEGANFTFNVHFQETTTSIYFRTGEGRAGQNLLFFGGTPIECLIRKIKPAHTTVTFTYES